MTPIGPRTGPRRQDPPAREMAATVEALLAIARSTVDADAAALWLLDEERGELRRVAASPAGRARGATRAEVGVGLVGEVFAERRSVRSADLLRDPRAAGLCDAADEAPPRTFLGVPLRLGRDTIGVLEMTSRRPDAFDPAQRGRASVLGDAAALLLEQARLAAEPPRAALAGAPLSGDDPVALATLDADLRVTDANAAFTRLVSRPVDALLGRPIITVLPALGRPRARDALEAALRGSSGHLGRLITDTEGGGQVVLSLSLIPVGDPAHGVHGVLLAATDVSVRARLEAELREQHARALEARDRLEQVVEVVSHELRTPLTSVLGYSRLLRDRPEAEADRRARWVELVIDKARLMARLVDEVTDLARLGSDRMRIEPVPTDLGELARQAAAETAATSERHQVVVTVDPATGQALVDRDRMAQVLANLLGNAVKFWPEGGTIRVVVASDPEGVRVDVEDGGPGVPADLAKHIFEPFFRGSSRPDVPGSGLGLAVSRGIVEAHGGRLWHERPEKGGARFRMVLPGAPKAG